MNTDTYDLNELVEVFIDYTQETLYLLAIQKKDSLYAPTDAPYQFAINSKDLLEFKTVYSIEQNWMPIDALPEFVKNISDFVQVQMAWTVFLSESILEEPVIGLINSIGEIIANQKRENPTVACQLADLRKKMGLNTSSFAEAAGINQNLVKPYEMSYVQPRLETLENIAHAFGGYWKHELVLPKDD